MTDILDILRFFIDSMFLIVDFVIGGWNMISSIIPNALNTMFYFSVYLGSFGVYIGVFCIVLVVFGSFKFVSLLFRG